MRWGFVLLATFMLTACWWGPGDPAALPAGEDLLQTLHQASKQPLGTAADIREIRKAITFANGPSMTITDVRWLSKVEAIVEARDDKLGTSGADDFLIVVRKENSGWVPDLPYFYHHGKKASVQQMDLP